MPQHLHINQAVATPDRQPQASDSDVSEAILDELSIEFRDLAISADFIVPDGMDAFLAYRGNRVILEVYNYKGGYVCRRNNGQVYNDPYSAIVGGYECYNPDTVLLARSNVERDRKIDAIRSALVPEYI